MHLCAERKSTTNAQKSGSREKYTYIDTSNNKDSKSNSRRGRIISFPCLHLEESATLVEGRDGVRAKKEIETARED